MSKSLIRQISQHSSEGGPSPALYRKASQRISAHDGSLILEKYAHKLSEQEEENIDGNIYIYRWLDGLGLYVTIVLSVQYWNKLIFYFISADCIISVSLSKMKFWYLQAKTLLYFYVQVLGTPC